MLEERARLLFVEDDRLLADALSSALAAEGYDVETVYSAEAAEASLASRHFDLIISDVVLPGRSGLDLAKSARSRDPDQTIVLMSGASVLDYAVQAIEIGVFKFLMKPIDPDVLVQTARDGLKKRRRAARNRRVLEAHPPPTTLEISKLDIAIGSLAVAYQPIVRWPTRTVLGREALVRSKMAPYDSGPALIEAAKRADKLAALGRTIRAHVAEDMPGLNEGELLFLNVRAEDLADDTLLGGRDPLGPFASKLVLEISEHAPIECVIDLTERLDALRSRGVKLALDEVGAGHAGLNMLALVRPEIVVLAPTLTRGIAGDRHKREIARSLVSFSRRTTTLMIAKGIEAPDDRDLLSELGCDIFQGDLFGEPVRAMTSAPRW